MLVPPVVYFSHEDVSFFFCDFDLDAAFDSSCCLHHSLAQIHGSTFPLTLVFPVAVTALPVVWSGAELC